MVVWCGILAFFAVVMVDCFYLLLSCAFSIISTANETQITWALWSNLLIDWLSSARLMTCDQMLICLLVGYFQEPWYRSGDQEISSVIYEPNWISLQSHQKIWEHISALVNMRLKINLKLEVAGLNSRTFSVQHSNWYADNIICNENCSLEAFSLVLSDFHFPLCNIFSSSEMFIRFDSSSLPSVFFLFVQMCSHF